MRKLFFAALLAFVPLGVYAQEEVVVVHCDDLMIHLIALREFAEGMEVPSTASREEYNNAAYQYMLVHAVLRQTERKFTDVCRDYWLQKHPFREARQDVRGQ